MIEETLSAIRHDAVAFMVMIAIASAIVGGLAVYLVSGRR